jgi:hypothetical protein
MAKTGVHRTMTWLERIGGEGIDRAHLQGGLPLLRTAIPAHDRSAETRRAQRQPGRSAEQARTEDGDAFDHGFLESGVSAVSEASELVKGLRQFGYD